MLMPQSPAAFSTNSTLAPVCNRPSTTGEAASARGADTRKLNPIREILPNISFRLLVRGTKHANEDDKSGSLYCMRNDRASRRFAKCTRNCGPDRPAQQGGVVGLPPSLTASPYPVKRSSAHE